MSRLEKFSHVSVILLAVIACLVMMEVGKPILAPATLGLVVGIVMSPLSAKVDQLGLPSSIAATASLIIILFVISVLAFFLEPAVQRAANSLPRVAHEINLLMIDVKQSLRGLEEASEGMKEAIGDGDAGQSGAESGDEKESAEDAIPTVEDAIWMAPAILSQIAIFAGTLFFFMLTRDQIYDFVAKRLVDRDKQRETTHKLYAAEKQVGKYFLTITLINSSYAVIISAAMIAIGMPAPYLWGIAAGLFNFILYLGPVAMMAAFLLGGLVNFEGWYALLPLAIYTTVNVIEAQFVTPALVGKALKVNALAIFLSLIFFLWLWGPIGGFVAIPLLLWCTILVIDIREVRRMTSEVPLDAEAPRSAETA